MASSKFTLPVATLDPAANAVGVELFAKSVGGVTQLFVILSDGTTAIPVLTRAGSPNGVVTAGKGALCADITNAVLYQNTDGATAWSVVGPATYPTIQDEGGALAGAPHSTLNFVGAGVVAANAGGGVATITVAGGVTVQDEGGPIANNPKSTLNFVGGGITAADGGGGVATITVPTPAATYPTIKEEGAALAGSPHSTLNFIGPNITAANAGGNTASITAFTSPTQLAPLWTQDNMAAGQANVALQITANFTKIRIVRDGWLCGLAANLSEAVTAGTVTAEVTVNGVGTGLSVTLTSASHPMGDVITRAKNITQLFQGDEIGVRLTTTAGFTPTTSDILCTVDVVEIVAA